MYRIFATLVLVMAAAYPAVAQEYDVSELQTRAEYSDFDETTRYAEVMSYLRAAVLASDRLHLTEFGYTTEGRTLPLLVFGDVWDASAAEIARTGKTRVFVQANIHAGEVCGKEALLILIRELASGAYADWADSLVLMMAPIYNADGNERISLYNRPRQHGPVGGMGQRPNAQGFDLNRDHMKLDSPEARSLVWLMNEYDPHVLIDLHTTNGTVHGYHLTYSPPLNPNTDGRIVDLLRERWLPEVRTTVRENYGWEFYYYGNVPRAGSSREPGWYTIDHRPRFNNNYVGLRNRIAILSEDYAYASFEDRIMAPLALVKEKV
ncbi:MAG: peptidase M14, partial [Gemmatimonadetes bacterium]|nr:peptidase M14 [Gemmatimonadota bacterium]